MVKSALNEVGQVGQFPQFKLVGFCILGVNIIRFHQKTKISVMYNSNVVQEFR